MKNILITGGSRGIGKATVEILAQNYNVIFTYNSKKILADEFSKELCKKGYNVFIYKMDIGNENDINALYNKIVEKGIIIDILINNAAISQKNDFLSISLEQWNRLMAVNLSGPFLLCQKVIPKMIEKKWGRIINIVSVGGQWGGVNQVHYAAAKAGLINLTKSLSKIYSKYGILTNAISPGIVETDMITKDLAVANLEKFCDDIPIGRIAAPDEIARAIRFLCSDDASYISGQTININGGMYFG